MKPERWQEISRIFNSAISLDPEERALFVKKQCGVDDALRAEVEKLIESHQKASDESFIDQPAVADGAELLLTKDVVQPEKSALQEGQSVGSYQVINKLGAGGMGEVYLARDTRLDRIVALKILPADVASDGHRMQRFRQEAKVASSLNQPNILTIFEFGEVDSLTFLATEYIDGETLRDHLRGKRLKLGEILDISIQILAALDAAHEAKIVHRDIKPENVMIRRRDHVVKVLDFGLAKLTEKKSSTLTGRESDEEAATEFKTAPGSVLGTVNYMSPEQAQAQTVDERTDLWSTGVIIYEMVAGSMPFKGATSSHTIVQIIEKDPVPLTQLAHVKAPTELQRIVLKAMAKSPDERYQTAKDMLIDLRSLKKRLDVEAEIERTSSPEAPRALLTTDEAPAVATQPIRERKSTQPDDVGRERQKKRGLPIALVGIAVVVAVVFGINAWRAWRAGTSSSVNPALVPVSERTLTYWITVQKFKDKKPYHEPFTLAGEINFEPDYQIRVNVRSPQPGYLYILNEGPAEKSEQPEFVVLFPSPTANKGSALVGGNQLVQIPDQSWLKFDTQQGIEKLWLVFANDTISELEGVKAFANPKDRGLITDAGQNKTVQNFLLSHSDPKPGYEKSDTETILKAPGKILVYAIKLEHH